MPAGTVPRSDGSFTSGKHSLSSPFDVDRRSSVKASPFDVGKGPGAGGPPPPQGSSLPLGRPPASAPPGTVEFNVHTDRTQYFVITSNTKENVVKSVRHSLWATQKKNEQKMDEAFRSAPLVVLIFSVNGSEAFQGYALMRSPIGQSRRRGHDLVDPFNGFGRLFDIEWLRLHDLSYREVETLRNPLNGDRPVRQSRDGQELANYVGRALCELIDRHIDDPESFAPREPLRQPVPGVLPGAGQSPYALGAPAGYTNGAPGSAYPALPGAGVAAPPTQFGRMLALPAPGGSKQPRRSSSSASGDEDNQRRKKKRRRERKYRHAPHPLLAGFEEHLDYFLSMDYDDYIQWFKRHGSVAPGPTAPPGTEAPESQHLRQQQPLPGVPPPHLAGMLSGAPMHIASRGPAPHSTPPWAGAMPHGLPPYGFPSHGPPLHGSPPHSLPPHSLPPHGMPHGMPPHGLPLRMY